MTELDDLARNLRKDIKRFDSQLNRYLGEGLSKGDKAKVYKEFGEIKNKVKG